MLGQHLRCWPNIQRALAQHITLSVTAELSPIHSLDYPREHSAHAGESWIHTFILHGTFYPWTINLAVTAWDLSEPQGNNNNDGRKTSCGSRNVGQVLLL